MKKLVELEALVSDLPENSRRAYEEKVLGSWTLTEVLYGLKQAMFWKMFWFFCPWVALNLSFFTILFFYCLPRARASQDLGPELLAGLVSLLLTILIHAFLSWRKEAVWKRKVCDCEQVFFNLENDLKFLGLRPEEVTVQKMRDVLASKAKEVKQAKEKVGNLLAKFCANGVNLTSLIDQDIKPWHELTSKYNKMLDTAIRFGYDPTNDEIVVVSPMVSLSNTP